MRFTTPRILIASTIINFGISWTILFGLVFGGRVLPVRLPLLALIALTLSIIIASLSIFAENWKRRWPIIVALGAVTFFLSCVVFMKLIDGGLRRAKLYAKSLVPEIETVRKAKGAWPANLKEIPNDRRPQVSFLERWPYYYDDYDDEDDLYDKVGGFVINYRVDDHGPKLAVASYDIMVDWNWKESRWEKQLGWRETD